MCFKTITTIGTIESWNYDCVVKVNYWKFTLVESMRIDRPPSITVFNKRPSSMGLRLYMEEPGDDHKSFVLNT